MPKRLNARSLSLTSQESYSAVIIADMIADVQDGQENKVNTKQETNLGCDGEKIIPSAAVVNVDSLKTVNLKGTKTNGTDISKGVILNALQFGQGDTKLAEQGGKHIPMQAAGEEPKEKLAKTSLSFQEMSLPRKIAFISSFLPSVLFVLCFAVILPCNKLLPCAQDQWFVTYNDTEITSDLKILQNLLFSFVNKEGAGVRGIATSTGDELWETKLQSTSSFIECGYLLDPKTRSCLVMDDKGTFHIIDPIKGSILWQEYFNDTEILPLPTIFPDCNKDGIDEIVLPVSNSKLLVFSQGKKSFLTIPDCESLPTRLLVWGRDNENDLLLICQKGENEILMRIPQNLWCDKNEADNGTISNLITTKIGLLSQSKIQLIREGFLAWSEDMVKMFTIHGKEKWILSNRNNSNKNQFLFQGRFKNKNKQIILISNGNSKNIQIARIDQETGEVLKTSSIPNTEISDAVLIYGETRDFILALKRKFTKSLRNEAVSQLNEMSSTVISILAKEEIDINTLNTSLEVTEEITIMDLNGKDIQTLHSQTVSYLKGGSHLSTLTVSEEKKEETKLLRVFILNKPPMSSTQMSLKSIQVVNWDVSSSKVSHCVWK